MLIELYLINKARNLNNNIYLHVFVGDILD